MQVFVTIQYLRAIAALLVVFYHATNGEFSKGMFGVDIFFVISGFIMWMTTYGREISPQNFLRRRLERIVPLYWTFTIVTALIVVGPPVRIGLETPIAWLISSLMFLPGAGLGGGHPGLPATFPVLSVGWTLNMEMMFYVLFALALFLNARTRIIFIVTVLSLFVVLGWTIGDSWHANVRFFADSIILEFAAGVLLAAALTSGKLPQSPIAGVILLIVGIALLISGLPAVEPRGLRLGAPALLICMGAIMLEPIAQKRPFGILRYLGDASYSIYLAHIPALTVARKLFGVDGSASPINAIILMSVATFVGVMVYKFYEAPIYRFLRKSRGAIKLTDFHWRRR